MSSTLQNNELIMLSSLAYFEEFSDFNSIKIFEGEKYDVGTFVEHALNEGYETCFNDALSDEKNGMVDILKLVNQNPRLTRLEIVYPDGFKDDDEKYKWKKDDTSSVCLVDPITKDVYVIFGGNYVAGSDAEFSTWVENFVGAASVESGEHKNALRFYKESIAAARAYLGDEDGELNITVSGHSTAGNMAQYVTIAYGADDDYKEKNDIDRCISVDGQGFSQEFIKRYAKYINKRAEKITSIVPNVSYVGSLMISLPGIKKEVVALDDVYVNPIKWHMPYQLLDENGDLRKEGNKSFLSTLLTIISNDAIKDASIKPTIDEERALKCIGKIVEEVFSSSPNKKEIAKCIADLNTINFLHSSAVSIVNDLTTGRLLTLSALSYGKDKLTSIKKLLFGGSEDPGNQIITSGDEEIEGASGDDELYAITSIHHRMFGRDGNDLIVGNEEYDYIFGEGDDDILLGCGGNDTIYGGFGNDLIHGGTGNDLIRGNDGEDELYGESGNDKIYGEEKNDKIYGGEGNDIIDGGEGEDEIYGDDGSKIEGAENAAAGLYDDEIHGGEGNDKINGEYGNDYIYGEDGEDEIYGGAGDDHIWGGEDNDTIYGDDEFFNETGDDYIYGGNGNDIIVAGKGKDHAWGDDGEDEIHGSSGYNYLFGGDKNDTIIGGIERDLIWGEEDDDTIDGSFGNDFIQGGNGNDTIDAGYGIDELYGGNGCDTYIITKDRQKNTILDIYGHNYLDFRKVSLDEVELAFSEETEDALNIKIKNTNDVFTIKKFSESVEKFSLVFHDESNPNKLSYYKFINNDGTIDVELQESNFGGASHINDNDTLWNKVQNDSKNNNAKKYEEAEKKQPPRDPLVIDFSENGTSGDEGLVNADDGVYFDLDNNGFAEKTAWISKDKGFLAYDRNGNGIIDNGSELFGDSVIMSDGRKSEHGFEALADFDSDKDGDIDKDDAKFKELLVWKDTKKNGRTDAGELYTLEELGIESISLTTENRNHTTDSGTIITDSAVVKRKDGEPLEIAEHWFEAHSYDTQELNIEGDGVSLTSFGIMPSLTNALAADESGELASLVEDFKKSDDFAEKRIITKKILYFITGANEIASDSRGGAVDARDLHVIEAIMGIDSFIGADGSATPNSNAAPILKELYVQFENLYLSLLDNELDGTGYIEYLEEVIDENNNIIIDPEYIDITIENIAMLGKNVEKIVFSIGSYLKTYDKACGTNCFEAFKERYPEYADVLDTVINADSVLGTANDDVIDGTKSSEIFWGDSGNDTINAGGGNDFIYGGAGNDVLNGGSGNDTYFFGKDHGNDVVNDRVGETKLVFTDGASAEDYDTGISVSGNQFGFTLTNKETGDTIFLPDFISLHDSYKIAFADNESTIGGGDAQETINGTDGNDYLEAGDGFNIFYGGDGEDTIAGGANIDIMYGGENDDTLLGRNGTNIMYGEGGNDKIYDGDDSSYLSGGEGNDELYGGGGADVLDGGSGNDYLQGDHGNDTYIFAEGYDVDTIAASSDLNKIIIHDYLVSDMNNTREANNDLVINFGTDTGDSLIVKAFFDYNSNRDYNFIFDDGTVLGQYDITAKSAPIFGTDGDDYLMGTNDDDTIDGGAGDDNLCGSGGEDTYIFGKGYAHDTINEWGSDHSIVELKDIASDEITVSDQWGSNLLIAVNYTEDVLTISNFKWGQASYTFRFADGAEGYVDKETWQLVLTKQPDPVEEDIEQTNAELLNEIYADNEIGADIFENDSAVISEVTDSITVSDNTEEMSDITNIQTMILAENMSAFSDTSNIYDNAGITDITADTTALDQLLVSSSVQ